MFDPIGLRVKDAQASGKFYVAALAPLGVGSGRVARPQSWLSQGYPPASPPHLGFSARNRAEADTFQAAALAGGAGR